MSIDGEDVYGWETLKVVSFTFCRRPIPSAHTAKIYKKVCARMWIIRNLKQAGIPSGKLVQVYYAMICPVMEYASPAFSTLMTSEQKEKLDHLQKTILKVILSFMRPYRE